MGITCHCPDDIPKGSDSNKFLFSYYFLGKFTFLRIYYFSSSKITRLVWVGVVFKYAHFCAISFDAFHTLHFAVLKIAIANVASIHFLFFSIINLFIALSSSPSVIFPYRNLILYQHYFFFKNLSMCNLCINKKIKHIFSDFSIT